MIIGLVVTGFDKGGLEQVVFNLYKGYQKKGIQTYILCDKPELMGYFATMLYDIRDFCVFNGNMEMFISFCFKKRITHLHYHYNTSFIELARMCGIRTMYTIHNVYTWFDHNTITEYANTISKCDSLIAVSSFVKTYFCERGEVRSDNVEVIPNGVDTAELFAPCKLPFKLTRNGLGLDNDNFVFAQIASFTPVKHQIGLIGAFELICKKNPKAILLFVGNVLDDSYYHDFANVLEASSAKSNIRIIPYFEHKYIGEFLRTVVNVSILATLQEGCSNTVLESVICGSPLIVTDVGNARDLQCDSVEIVNRPYNNLYELNNELINKLSHQKYTSNIDEIVEKSLQMIDNYMDFKEKAKRNQAQIEFMDINHMVNNYITRLESIK